jgi:hypothetical protein
MSLSYSPESTDVEWLDFYYADGICYEINRYELAHEFNKDFDFYDDDQWLELIEYSKTIHDEMNYEIAEDIEIKVGRANNDDKRSMKPTKARAKERRIKSNLLDATHAKQNDKIQSESESETELDPVKRHRVYQRGTPAFEKKKINENKRKQPRTHSADEMFQPFTWNEHKISPEEERLILQSLCSYHAEGLGVTTDMHSTKQGKFMDYALSVRYELEPPQRKSRDPVYDKALPLADVQGYVLPRRVIKPKLNWKQTLQATW